MNEEYLVSVGRDLMSVCDARNNELSVGDLVTWAAVNPNDNPPTAELVIGIISSIIEGFVTAEPADESRNSAAAAMSLDPNRPKVGNGNHFLKLS